MGNESMGRDRDLVLAPGEFAYVLDTTKGLVNINVGPYKNSMSTTDQPVVFDKDKLQFQRVELDRAIQREVVAPEGFYLALYNPSMSDATGAPVAPVPGRSLNGAELRIGNRINIPGPANFALWPGQMAEVIRGHHLRSNQYLLAQVYNDQEATANWRQAVLKPAGGEASSAAAIAPTAFTPGQLIVIKGTEVAFFIPPTGVKVVPDGGSLVREAVTLERLQYCILLDEDGNKRFVQGPSVVFPEPTERFIERDGHRAFQAIELNETTGIYVKVIADYYDGAPASEGDAVVHHKAGDELFITGAEQAIYFQREEHAVIRYQDQTKHYAVAIPVGEGRYVLNRRTGGIRLARGPQMLLCDPRFEVIVRRGLSEHAVRLWYPGNERVLALNRTLAAQAAVTGTDAYEVGRAMTTSGTGAQGATAYAALNAIDEQALRSRQLAGDTLQRGAKFTAPRTITLDTKYEGAVSIVVWTNYAVLVISKTGERRVVEGPAPLLLEYDETLAQLALSTGKPKSGVTKFETVYLKVRNNTVSDIVEVETSDLVRAKLQLAYRVNFEKDAEGWFQVEDYVGLLTDHMRSLLRSTVKKQGIEQFYANATEVVRDAVLGVLPADGSGRPGRTFSENNMRIHDVEVLSVEIQDGAVLKLLHDAQRQALQSVVQITAKERQRYIDERSLAVDLEMADIRAETAEHVNTATRRELEAALATALARVESEMRVETERLEKQDARADVLASINTATLARDRAKSDQELELRRQIVELTVRQEQSLTEETVKRAAAVDAKLSAALTVFADSALSEKITVALAPMAAMYNITPAEVLSRLFKGTAFGGVMDQLATRATIEG